MPQDVTSTVPQDENLMEEELLNDEELDDDEDDEDAVEESDKESGKRTRKTLSPENVYVFAVADPDSEDSVKTAARQAKEGLKHITYTDRTSIFTKDEKTGEQKTDWRVWRVGKGLKYDDNGKLISGVTHAFVCANTRDYAARFFLTKHQGFKIELLEAKRRRGRQKKLKIEEGLCRFAEMLKRAMSGTFGEEQKELAVNQWNEMFAPGCPYAHYVDEKGNVRKPTE